MVSGEDDLLIRTRGLDTIEAAYGVWLELKLQHAAALAKLADERRRLEQQGSFLVGAVRAAKELHAPSLEAPAPDALAPRDEALGGFLHEAEQKLSQALSELEARTKSEDERFRTQLSNVRAALSDKVRGFLGKVRPRLGLWLRPVGATRNIVHVDRPSPDEAVLLCLLFTGRIPTRYDFLFDDSTDDVSLPPASLYPDEGVEPSNTRPPAAELVRLFDASPDVLPIKGQLPVPVTRPGGGRDFFRLLMRGPVLELEIADADGFRNLLAKEEAERFAGYLVGLKLSGRVELEIRAD